MPKYNVVFHAQLKATDPDRIRKQITEQKSGKVIINLLGRTGSGKGTQSAYLSAKTGLPHISIGDLFRDEVREKTSIGKLIEFFEEQNPNVFPPDEIWFGLLIKRLSKPDCAKGYILDNFPRTAAQAKVLMQAMLTAEDQHIPIFMDLDEKTIKNRLKERYICGGYGKQFRGHECHTGECDNLTCNKRKLEHRPEDCDEVKMNRRFATFNANIGEILSIIEARDLVYYLKLYGNESPVEIAINIDRLILNSLIRRADRRFFIMRHSESMATANPNLFTEMVPDSIRLTAYGHSQSRLAGDALKKYFLQNPERRLKIIINNAVRIVETKDNIVDVLHETVSSVIIDKRADELEHGEFNAVPVEHMLKKFPEIFDKFYYCGADESKLLESYKVRLPSGESKEDLYRNTAELIYDVESTADANEDILFIGHGANCRALEAVLIGEDGKWLAREYDTMPRGEIKVVQSYFSKLFFKVPAKKAITISAKQSTRIAIIGAAASGTAMLASLIQKMPIGAEIFVFNQTDIFGPGYVYDLNQPPCFLLNRNVKNTQSIWGNESFAQWLSNNSTLILAKHGKWKKLFPDSMEILRKSVLKVYDDAILPRSVYGMYLAECFSNLIKLAKSKGINVVTLKEMVIDVSSNSISFGTSHSPMVIDVDFIIFSSGHWQSSKPIEYGYAKGFYNNPIVLGLAHNDMTKIKDKQVLIKGASLSAIDAAVLVLELGAKKVTMFSRHGKLNSISGLWKERPLQHLTLENLEKLASEQQSNKQYFRLDHVFQLMVKELQLVGIELDWEEIKSPANSIQSMRVEIDQCRNGQEFVWRTIFESAFPIHQEIFKKLHPDDKKVFITHFFSTFMSYNATTPLASLERLLKYVDDGKLEVRSGEVDISYDQSTQSFFAKFTSPEPVGVVADILINGLGQDRNIDNFALSDSMLRQNIFVRSAFGGVKVDDNYNLISGDGTVQPNIFANGVLINGAVLNYSNFETLCHISAKIAENISKILIKKSDEELDSVSYVARNSADYDNRFLPGFNLFTLMAAVTVTAGSAYYIKSKLKA